MAAKRYWLFKTEPESYGIADLKRDTATFWDGVRNYQARNFLRDAIKTGDGVLFYHSNASPPAIVGVARVTRDGYPDHTQFEQGHRKFDPKASEDNPRWYMVDIAFETEFPRALPLDELRGIEALEGMELLRTGSRLSIQPVRKAEWDTILRLAKK
ncbi:MAG: EVE domain-containing protein [Bacteroidetes bacterium]|nr:EVE domain-containing protein [Bacteroidota bacterium]